MKTRLYICGPMSGLPDNNRPAFAEAAAQLRAAGFDVWSPAEHPEVPGWTTEDYLVRVDLPAMSQCHGVALLDGWEHSTGAMAEYEFACACGMACDDVDNWLYRPLSRGTQGELSARDARVPERVTLPPVPVNVNRDMTVIELIEYALKANGYDGLCLPGECGCRVGDLCPCGEPSTECEAGNVREAGPECPDLCGIRDESDGPCWCVRPGKREANDEPKEAER